MSWLELSLFITAFGGIGVSLAKAQLRRIHLVYVLLALLGVTAAHICVDGFKWKWVPIYVLLLLLVSFLSMSAFRSKKAIKVTPRKWLRITTGSIAVTSLGICLGIGYYLFPTLSFDAPSGTYSVGTTAFHWQDPTRAETYTQEDSDHREVMVRLWYPADTTEDAAKASYGFDWNALQLSGDAPLLFKAIAQSNQKVKTNAYVDVPLSSRDQTYPVILFSPADGASNFMYTTFVEELASQGYIVASIQHPYFNLFPTKFPDGRVASGVFNTGGAGDWEESEAVLSSILVKDVQFVIDKLESLNHADSTQPFAKRMDFSRLGMAGHSFGGTLAAQVMNVDDRIKAGINMDGFLYGKKLTSGLDQPFMYMFTGTTEEFENRRLEKSEWGDRNTFALPTEAEYARIANEQAERHKLLLQNGGYNITFPKANHFDFSDVSLYSPLIGNSHTNEHHDIINQLILAFFDKHLNGEETSLLKSSNSKLYTAEEIPMESTLNPATPKIEGGIPQGRLDSIKNYVEEQFRKAGIYGGTYAIIHREQVVLTGGYGRTNDKDHIAPDENTLYSLGSVTKVYTSMAILQMQEEGLLQIDDPVQKYIPWFRFDDEKLSERVSLRHLLIHAAGGVSSWPTDGLLFDEPDTSHSLEQYVRALSKAKMTEEPGTSAAYCNACIDVLGHVIEKVSGMSYSDYMEQKQFQPLGMTHTLFGDRLEQVPDLRVAKENFWFFLRKTQIKRTYDAFGEGQDPDGGLYSTMKDMGKFISWQLGYGKDTLLSRQTIADSWKGEIETESGDAFYTTGGYVEQLQHGARTLVKGGDGIGSAAFMLLLPEQEAGVVVVVGEFHPEIQEPITRGIASIVLGYEPEPIPFGPTFGRLMGGVAILLLIVAIALLLLQVRRFTKHRMRASSVRRMSIYTFFYAFPAAFIWYILIMIRPSGVFFYGYPYDIAIGLVALAVALSVSAVYYFICGTMKVLEKLRSREVKISDTMVDDIGMK